MNLLAPATRFPLVEGNGSARAVAVASDFAGLERCAYELFRQAAEDTQRSALARAREAALNPRRLEQSLPASGPPAIPLSYQLWLAYLLWLEEVLHALDCRPGEVSAVELGGLQALARARDRFLRAHQLCPRCHAVNPRPGLPPGAAARCRRCFQEI